MAKYEVSVTSIQSKVMVEADYFVIEAGHLVFRNVLRSEPPYLLSHKHFDTVTVRAFTQGYWTQVERLPDELGGPWANVAPA